MTYQEQEVAEALEDSDVGRGGPPASNTTNAVGIFDRRITQRFGTFGRDLIFEAE